MCLTTAVGAAVLATRVVSFVADVTEAPEPARSTIPPPLRTTRSRHSLRQQSLSAIDLPNYSRPDQNRLSRLETSSQIPNARSRSSLNTRDPTKKPANVAHHIGQSILIAIVGVTGSGKSSFVQRVTERTDVPIGKGLAATTDAVQTYSLTAQGINFTLVDTPGFDDTDLEDEDIYLQLCEWLESSYRSGQRLSGMLFLHRIIDTKQKGSSLRNLRMFQKLCGEDNFANVVLGVTWLDKEDPEVAAARLKALRETPEFWGDMIKRGSRVVDISQDRDDCIQLLVDMARNQAKGLKVQDEVVCEGRSPKDTAAAAEMQHFDAIKAVHASEELERTAQQARYRLQQDKARREARNKSIQQHRSQEMLESKFKATAALLAQQKKADEQAEKQRIQREAREQKEYERQKRKVDAQKKRAEAKILKIKKAEEKAARKLRIRTLIQRNEERSLAIAEDWYRILGYLDSDPRLYVQYVEYYVFSGELPPSIFPQVWVDPGNGTYELFRLQQPFMLWCSECSRPIPNCSYVNYCECCDDGAGRDFVICTSCTASGVQCLSHEEHPPLKKVYIRFVEGKGANSTPRCSRTRTGGPRNIQCDNCKETASHLYLHCCGCRRDDFDLCSSCWGIRGTTCYRPTTSRRRGHDLHVLLWSP